MFKQIIALVAFSAAIVFSMSYAKQGVQLLLDSHDLISQMLTHLFSQGQAGNIAKGLIALLSVPVLVGLVPTIIYWMVRRHWFPYFMDVVWIVWLIQAGALVMLSQ